jgi:alkanesulfonate monooxygenase SsuD/methylene tetrahydromethanopterin reductase-like flavin-dependent oxidoreductase (luciferase family)
MGRGFGVSAAVAPAVLRDVAREVEQHGYSSFWVNDMPHADGLAALAAVAAGSLHIAIGVGVVPLDQRSPAVIADRVRALELPVDRLLLGVGGGDQVGALARVRAGVDTLQHTLDARIVVGALGPRMAALAGEAADGVLLNWLTPEHAELASGWVRTAAEDASRAVPVVMAYVRCGLLPGAGAPLDRELERYDGLPHFEQHLRRMGADARDTCVLRADGAALNAGIARYDAMLDETIVRAVTPDTGLDTLLALVRACAPSA